MPVAPVYIRLHSACNVKRGCILQYQTKSSYIGVFLPSSESLGYNFNPVAKYASVACFIV